MTQATYECAICGHTHGVRNLVLHCGYQGDANYGLLWIAPADTEPAAASTSVLPAHYLDAGLIELPEGVDDTGQTCLDLVECNRVSLDLARRGGRWHLIVDAADGMDRIRWSAPDATVTPGPLPTHMTAEWRCSLTVAADPATVTWHTERPQLD